MAHIKHMAKKLQLDTDHILRELQLTNQSVAWLARQLGVSRQAMHETLRRRPITFADKVGNVLGINPKDLIL